jgi:predicted aspartyl protease
VTAGYFTENGLPYVPADLILPRLGVVAKVRFLVDTGSVSTVLHSDDADDMGCPFDELVLPTTLEGVGGAVTYYRESALVKLGHEDDGPDFAVEISIAKPDSSAGGLDSLLGRDILNRLRMEYDFPQGWLTLVQS